MRDLLHQKLVNQVPHSWLGYGLLPVTENYNTCSFSTWGRFYSSTAEIKTGPPCIHPSIIGPLTAFHCSWGGLGFDFGFGEHFSPLHYFASLLAAMQLQASMRCGKREGNQTPLTFPSFSKILLAVYIRNEGRSRRCSILGLCYEREPRVFKSF